MESKQEVNGVNTYEKSKVPQVPLAPVICLETK